MLITISENMLLFSLWKSGDKLHVSGPEKEFIEGYVAIALCTREFKFTNCVCKHEN